MCLFKYLRIPNVSRRTGALQEYCQAFRYVVLLGVLLVVLFSFKTHYTASLTQYSIAQQDQMYLKTYKVYFGKPKGNASVKEAESKELEYLNKTINSSLIFELQRIIDKEHPTNTGEVFHISSFLSFL